MQPTSRSFLAAILAAIGIFGLAAVPAQAHHFRPWFRFGFGYPLLYAPYYVPPPPVYPVYYAPPPAVYPYGYRYSYGYGYRARIHHRVHRVTHRSWCSCHT